LLHSLADQESPLTGRIQGVYHDVEGDGGWREFGKGLVIGSGRELVQFVFWEGIT